MVFCSGHLEDDHDVALFCVFDGHGGRNCSKKLKKEFPEIFYNWFLRKNGYAKKDLTEIWSNAYKEMEKELLESSLFDFMGYT
jgi:serine/threonine protein phosphatase PrpC